MTVTEYPESEMEKINRFTKGKLSSQEVYCFEVVLCDNEVDRDGECFSSETLDGLANLYLGKTGIFDHNPSGKNQTARIYECWTEEIPEKMTKLGMPYKRLKAKAYVVRTKKNEDLILEIEGGIKKEVSVGCKVGKKVCSICGTDWYRGSCTHQKGNFYQDKLCCVILKDPIDAYEWSFVAVPAQPAAGIIKAYQNGKREEKTFSIGGEKMPDYQTVKEKLSFAQEQKSEEIVLSKEEGEILLEKMLELEQQSEYGFKFLQLKRADLKHLILLSEEQLSPEVVASVVEKMDLKELEQYEAYYRKKNGMRGLFRENTTETAKKKVNWDAMSIQQNTGNHLNEGFKI